MLKHICLYLSCILLCQAVQYDDWQPVLHPAASPVAAQHQILTYQQPLLGSSELGSEQQQIGGAEAAGSNQCEVYKVGFVQDLYFQYIHYKTHIPDLKEFTLCFWSKFTSHNNDHPIFSYAVDGQPKAISSWVSNTNRSSYFSLAVEGQTFYRLNYPLRQNKWYHTCQSWNGKTGEWQIWVNAERVGRGFHNRLVGHTIPSGGLAITGQEQTQLGGGFQEGHEAPKGAGGMLGEITMLQFYSVALTAGKAHRDHKHHHAHQYDHNGNQITTPAPPTTTPRSTLPTHPLLTGGQINPNLMLNFAGGQPQQQQPQIIPGQNFNAQLVNGQFVGSLVTQQLIQGRGPQRFQPQPGLLPQQQQQLQFLQPSGPPIQAQPLPNSGLVHSSLVNPANVQFIDTTLDTHQLFKRQNGKEGEQKNLEFGAKIVKKRQSTGDATKAKRELYISGGAILDDGGLVDTSFLNGLAGIGENAPILEQQKQNDEREPAEAEVKAVMNICNGCDEEPFEKALVFGWRTVPKKLYSGAFYSPAVPQCKVF